MSLTSLPLNDNSIDYETYSMIKNTERIVLDCGGTIFGAYVGKVVLHDFNANKFFESIKDDENESSISYGNKNVNPETYEGRMTKPKYMDCIMTTKQFENLKKELKKRELFYTSKNNNSNEKKKICSPALTQSIKSMQYLNISFGNKDIKNEMVNFLKKNISNNIFKNIISETAEFKAIIDSTERLSSSFPEFEMKIYILKDGLEMVEGIKNICSYADFYSQCLIMDINSIYVLKKHQELYLKMTNKLFNRKYISPLNSMEILEGICIQILQKKDISTAISFIQKNDDHINFQLGIYSGELCILCQEDILEDCLSVKLKCCNAHYHFDCVNKNINKFIKNDKFCIMCNKKYKKPDIIGEWKEIINYYTL